MLAELRGVIEISLTERRPTTALSILRERNFEAERLQDSHCSNADVRLVIPDERVVPKNDFASGVAAVSDRRISSGQVGDAQRAPLQQIELRAEKLLLATGRRPNSDKINIEKAGVEVGKHGEVRVDEFLRTNVRHIFAAGDVIGRETGSQMATPVGSQDGGIAAHNAFSNKLRTVNHRVIPRTIFTDPQIATVGMTEEEAIAAGHSCWCSTVPMPLVPRAGAIRDMAGMIKMVADDDTEEVLGVSMVGNSAGEVIHEAAMAMRFHAKIQDFIDMLHVYPTMAEALKIVAISRRKDPAKLSCCAE
jgi:mercuric reductase